MSDLDDFMVHTVTATPKTGDGAYGPVYGEPAALACWVDETTRLVRSPTGAQIVSSATVYAPAGTTALTPGGTVILPTGRTTTVIGVAHHDSGPLGLPDHVEATVE